MTGGGGLVAAAPGTITGRQRLRSAHRQQLHVPRYQRSTLARRAFSVAGPLSGTRFQTNLEIQAVLMKLLANVNSRVLFDFAYIWYVSVLEL